MFVDNMNELLVTQHGVKLGKKSERFFVSGEKIDEEIPASDLGLIIINSNVNITSSAIQLAAEHNIPIHIGDKYGNPLSTIYPTDIAGNPELKIQQLKFRETNEGLSIAKKFAKASIVNRGKMMTSLGRTRDNQSLKEKGKEILKLKEKFKEIKGELNRKNRETIMNIEGRGAKKYYKKLTEILPEDIFEGKRKRKPPRDCFNAALSYGYGVLYPRVHKSVIYAGLNPYLSFLHAEYGRRPGLVMDLVEEFRQPVVDRAVINLSIRGQLSSEDVSAKENGVLLNKQGRKKVADEVLDKLSSEKKHRGEKTKIKRHIRNQSILLANHILKDKTYKPFMPRRM